MKSGYKILWSHSPLAELKRIIFYLEENWSEKEISKFSKELEKVIKLITDNPTIFSNCYFSSEPPTCSNRKTQYFIL